MTKNLCPVAVALAALAAPAFAQTGTQVALPAYNNTYNGFSRGYSFTAGSNFFIQDTELDATAQQAGDTMSIRVVVNGTEVMYSAGTPGPIVTPAGGPLSIFAGDLVEVVGNWSPAVTGNFSAMGVYAGAYGRDHVLGVYDELIARVADGSLGALPTRVHGFDEVPDVLASLAGRTATGKAIIRMGGPHD